MKKILITLWALLITGLVYGQGQSAPKPSQEQAKMKKILLCIAMLALFVVSCGGGKSAKEKDVIKIGVIGPLTGNLAQYGTSSINGLKLKVKEINDAGGINGKKIEIVEADSKGDVQEAINAFKKMVSQDKIDIFVGEVTSGPSLAIAPLAQQAKIPMITSTGTAFDITKDKDFVFRTTFTDPYQGVVAAKYAKSKNFKNVTILTNTGSDYSVGLANAFKEQATKEGIQVKEEQYTADDKDFRALLTKIKGTNPEVIFVPDYYNTIGLILTQTKELGINAQFLGGDGWDGIQKDFGQVANGALFASQFAPDDTSETVQKFITAYKNEYKVDPIIFAALGYDTGTILETALKSVSDLSSKEAIRDAIKNFSGEHLVTGSLKYDENRNPEKKVTFIEVKDGKLTLKEKF